MKIVYYTSSVAGTGRIVQAMSIHNALLRKGVACEFIIVSSAPPELAAIADRFCIPRIEIPVESSIELSPENCHDSVLYQTLTELDPDILIVDRLWFTLYHFIDELECKKIFFSIQVSDNFYSIKLQSHVMHFKPEQYDCVLAIEPFDCVVKMKNIAPMIIRNRDEIYDRQTALDKLGFTGDKKICLIALNYKDGYFEHMKEKYAYLEDEGYQMLYTTNLKGGGIFPIVDYYNAIDLVVCAAGYTQFWEVQYFRKKAIFECFPLNFSDMQRRMRECSDVFYEENGCDQIVDNMLGL